MNLLGAVLVKNMLPINMAEQFWVKFDMQVACSMEMLRLHLMSL